jgi:iron complex outermembrane recepter protein
MKTIFKLIFLLGIQFLYSQNTLSGTVKDASNESPIANVYVFISELNKGVLTNNEGNYVLNIEAKGRLNVQFSHLGYQTVLQSAVVDAANTTVTLDVVMKESTANLNEIVVTHAFENEFKQNTFKTDVVHKDDIQKVGGFTVMDVLNKIPGVDATTTGTLISRPVIRGLSSNRILTLIDGVRFETQQWDDEHGIGVNENGVEKIEVVKGPESLLYGPEAMGGVVNFIQSKPAPVGTIQGSAFASMSRNNHGWRALANVDGAKEKLNWGVSALGKLFSDYFINNQSFRVPNTRLSEYGAKAYAGTNQKWGATRLSYTFNQAFFGILDGKDILFGPNGEIINTDIEKEKYPLETEAPFHTVVDHRVISATNFLLGKSKLDAIFSYQNNHRTENEEFALGKILGKKGYKYVDMTLQSLTYNVKWNTPKWGRFSSIVGSQGMLQNNQNNSGAKTVLIPDASIADFGFFAVSKYEHKALNATLGARFDARNLATKTTLGYNYAIPEISRSYNNVSTSLGLAYTIAEDLVLRTSFATGYRSPNLNELTSNGYKLESRRFEIGNANFDKEHNNQFDFSATYEGKNISLETSFFFNRVNNYIYIASTGNLIANNINPAEMVAEYKFYQSNAELIGGEARLDLHPVGWKWMHFETNFSTLEGKRTDNDSHLPMMTPTKLSNTLYFNCKDFWKLSKNSFNINLASTFDQNKVEANELKTKGYCLVNFGWFTSYKSFDFTLTANNLLDKNYVNHMSRFRPFNISEPGMNIAIGCKKNF